jgi:hypothetical protein
MTRATRNNLCFISPEVISVPFTPGGTLFRLRRFPGEWQLFLDPLAQFIQFAQLGFEINCGADDDCRPRVSGSCKARTHLNPKLTKNGR